MDREEGRASVLVSGDPPADNASRVAAVTVSFWILKIVTTSAGDLSGDALSISLRLGYELALIVTVAVTVALLLAQLKTKRFHPTLYWVLILSTSAAGAEISDSMDRALHWGNAGGAGLLLVCLAATLAVWYARCGAIGSYRIESRRDELFYWLAAVLANSLGSALGDLVGDKLGVGLLGGTAFNLGILALLLALHYTHRVGKGPLFWAAFVFSRIPF